VKASSSLRGLVEALFKGLRSAKLPLRVLARLQMNGNFIWSEDSDIFLDGELFSSKSKDQLQFPSGDKIRGGKVDMWVWLVVKQ